MSKMFESMTSNKERACVTTFQAWEMLVRPNRSRDRQQPLSSRFETVNFYDSSVSAPSLSHSIYMSDVRDVAP